MYLVVEEINTLTHHIYMAYSQKVRDTCSKGPATDVCGHLYTSAAYNKENFACSRTGQHDGGIISDVFTELNAGCP